MTTQVRTPVVAVRTASEVAPEPVAWLWPGNFALGKVAVVAGAAGGGKTLLVAGDFAARVSAGSPWPDGSPCPRGDVLIASGQDSPADTLVPRLRDHGADLTRVHFVEGIGSDIGSHVAGGTGGGDGGGAQGPDARAFTLGDVPALERVLGQRRGVRLVVIDPVSAFLGRADGNSSAGVRNLLAPLQRLAERQGAAVVLVTHLRKAAAATAAHAVLGSVALVAAARVAWLLTRDAHDPERRVFTVVKNNLGRDRFGYAWRLSDGKVKWEKKRLDLGADAALADAGGAARPTGPREALAAAFVTDFLKDGPRSWGVVVREGRKAGHTAGTLERARGAMAETYKLGGRKGRWLWRLAGDRRTEPVEGEMEKLERHFETLFEPELE